MIRLLLPLIFSASAIASPTEDFNALLDEHWEWTLEAYPTFASRVGDTRYNTLWTDRSLDAIAQRNEELSDFLRRLYAIPRVDLSAADQLNHELFRRLLTEDIEEYTFKNHLLPFSQRGGVQNLESLADRLALTTDAKVEDWLERMRAVDEQIETVIAVAERGMRDGYTSPRILMERLPAQIRRQLVEDGQQSPFYSAFETLPPSVERADEHRANAVDVIEGEIVPAYRELLNWFENTYLPACRDTIGVSELPKGDDWYAFLARKFTTTSMTPDEIHRLGLNEVKRIRDEMQSIIDELEFEGDFADFLTFLRTDPQFYFDTPGELYDAYLAMSKRIDPELVKLFGRLPRMPYGVKPIPDAIAPDTTTAYYMRPAGDGSRAGIYYVNLFRPEVRPKYEIEVLSVHEAMPGHHLQIALQQELEDVPRFRRFQGFTAFTEGWGLYSEVLGYDLGLYEDPYSRFGQLTYDMWRAVRLVVDTGMHAKGWSRQQAIDFFMDNAAKTEHDVVNEIDRYLVMPGQALAYKVGQLKILQLRRDAETALGERFDIRAFHDELLGAGALPLDLLEQRMNRWLEAELAQSSD